MRNNKSSFTWLIILAMFLVSSSATAEEPQASGPSKVEVGAHQAVIQVQGIVCSFCAYGVSKKLSKLDFLDKTRGGKNGVATDIEEGKVTVFLDPNKEVNVEALKHAVEDGGYEVIQIYLNEGEETKEVLS